MSNQTNNKNAMQVQANPNGTTASKHNKPTIVTLSIDTTRFSQNTFGFVYATTNEKGEVYKVTATATANDKGRIYLPTNALGLENFKTLDITDKVKYMANPSCIAIDYKLTKRSPKEQALKSLTTTVATADDIANNERALERILDDMSNGTATIDEALKGAKLLCGIVGATLVEYHYSEVIEAIEKKQSTLEQYKKAQIPDGISEATAQAIRNGNEAEAKAINEALAQLGRERATIENLVKPLQDLAQKCTDYYNNGKNEQSIKMRSNIASVRSLANKYL
jgi:hypothetical protein